jgi:hypothetical protein
MPPVEAAASSAAAPDKRRRTGDLRDTSSGRQEPNKGRSPWESSPEAKGMELLDVQDLVIQAGGNPRTIACNELKINAMGVCFANFSTFAEAIDNGISSTGHLALLLHGSKKKMAIRRGASDAAVKEFNISVQDPLVSHPEVRAVTLINLGKVPVSKKQVKGGSVDLQCKETIDIVFECFEQYSTDKQAWAQITADPQTLKTRVSETLQQAQIEMAEEVTFYHPRLRQDSMSAFLKVRVLKSDREKVLATSGKQSICNHEIIEGDSSSTYVVQWLPSKTVDDITHMIRSISCTVHPIANDKGLGVRCLRTNLGEVRTITNKGDPRYIDGNREVVHETFWVAQGFQRGTAATPCARALLEFGWPAVPLHREERQGVCSWTVAAQAAPPEKKYVLKNGTEIHIYEAPEPPNKKGKSDKKKGEAVKATPAVKKTKAKKEDTPVTCPTVKITPTSSTSSTASTSPSVPSSAAAMSQYAALAARVTNLEAGHRRLETGQTVLKEKMVSIEHSQAEMNAKLDDGASKADANTQMILAALGAMRKDFEAKKAE